jgi:CRISPR-associated endonuclease/helicase Cas3
MVFSMSEDDAMRQVFKALPAHIEKRLGVLWGKSRQGVALLLEHMLDSAATAELLWDRFLAPAQRRMLERAAGGKGRELFAWLCGVHDIGKATPSFQCKVSDLAERVRATGLPIPDLPPEARQTRHSDAGGAIVWRELKSAGWADEQVAWVWPMVAGHHGVIRPGFKVYGSWGGVPPDAIGKAGWPEIQRSLLELVAITVGFADLAQVQPAQTPRPGEQLVISGLIIMADWLASNDFCRGGETDLSRLGLEVSRRRAERVWAALRLRGGWDLAGERPRDLMRQRFGRSARPLQKVVESAAYAMPAPGLMIVEAPMGEGKTEAALVAAEVLAHRFGLHGIFVGMPTQATSDPMFHRVRAWSGQLGQDLPVALAHGKARFNREWRGLMGVDRLGEVGSEEDESTQVIRWFLGRDRPLLTPICVGTVDNMLHAATRTKRVSLRFAGLGGKVVLLDEIHSYSVYTQEFLKESLRWLGSAGSPVILLTATLPPQLKQALASAYLEGAVAAPAAAPSLEKAAYPLVSWVARAADDSVEAGQVEAASALRPRKVAVEVLPDCPDGSQADLVPLLGDLLQDGGRALVVCNTVRRAQMAFESLRQVFGPDVELLHARFTAADRARQAEKALEQFGPAAEAGGTRILVGTQVLEQSLDLDADVLICDIAPMDLLLQRLGRCHRHLARDPFRPERLMAARLIVTGVRLDDGGPEFPAGVTEIYRPDILFKTTALVLKGQETGWDIPGDIPGLVSLAYGGQTDLPEAWLEGYKEVAAEAEKKARERLESARPFLLGQAGTMGKKSLDGLHAWSVGELPDEDAISAVVRDGPESVEVMLARQGTDGLFTLSGRRLTKGGQLVGDDEAAIEEAAGCLVRLPANPGITRQAKKLPPSDALEKDPDLGGLRVLAFDADGTACLGGYEIGYDPLLGLVAERSRGT